MKSILKHDKIINLCAIDNPPGYNKDKILEEMSEFQQVMLKLITKHPDNRPDKVELIKEFGDLVYRGMIYLYQEFPEFELEELVDKVNARIDKKLKEMETYRKDDVYNEKYKGTL